MVGTGFFWLPAPPTMTNPVKRCAIYTRKSSEEGLEQAFNSLDAQREACEAYIKSQAHEGWQLLSATYDDGGYSGGNMERPALKRLMGDVEQHLVDVVIVYKVDRLTRSLADFAKIVEVLDRQGASFVAVTQQFNTTTSMGRLTLNVLLSFAQFEREVTGERIRDKIAASKRRGMWMGGNPPLGYDRMNKQLVVNESEALIVNEIFRRYLRLGTVAALQMDSELRDMLATTEVKRGKRLGRTRYGRGALYNLLRNEVYIGRIPHKDVSYPGQHVAIIDQTLWSEVQEQIAANRSGDRTQCAMDSDSALGGLLYDDTGNLMSPSFTKKRGGLCYRYYVSQAILQNDKSGSGSIGRLPAPVIEEVVADALTKHLSRERANAPNWRKGVTSLSLREALERVVIGKAGVEIHLRRGPPHKLLVPGVLTRTGKGLAFQRFGAPLPGRPKKQNLALVKAVCRAHHWRQLIETGVVNSYDELARRERMNRGYVRRVMQLAFLAPDLIEEIVSGRLVPDMGLVKLTSLNIPMCWRRQRRLLERAYSG
jgi:site-specific DNA recombinase